MRIAVLLPLGCLPECLACAVHAVGLDLGGSGLDESWHLSNYSKSWSVLGAVRAFYVA